MTLELIFVFCYIGWLLICLLFALVEFLAIKNRKKKFKKWHDKIIVKNLQKTLDFYNIV